VVAAAEDAGDGELLCPDWIRCDEDRDTVDQPDARVETGLGVMLGCLLRAHGEIIHQKIGAAGAQYRGDIDAFPVARLKAPVGWVVGHVRRDAVKYWPHLYGHAAGG